MDIKSLNNIISTAKFQRSQLIILCGAGSEKIMKKYQDKYEIETINISLELSKKLINIAREKRSIRVYRYLTEILKKCNSNLLWINRMQLLFHPELEFEPIAFFQNASRNKVIILSWNGIYKNNKLIYAEPGHQEYRVFSEIDAQIVAI